jgi:hypothetical protein
LLLLWVPLANCPIAQLPNCPIAQLPNCLARIAGPIAGLLGPISRNWGCIEEAKGIKLIPPPSGGGRGYAPDPIKEKKKFFFDSLGSISSPKTLAVSSPVLPQHKPKDIDNIRNIMRLSLSEEQRKRISMLVGD